MNSAHDLKKNDQVGMPVIIICLFCLLAGQQIILKCYALIFGVTAGPENAYITTKIVMVMCGVSMFVLALCKVLEIDWKALTPKAEQLKTDLIWGFAVSFVLIIGMELVRLGMNARSRVVAARPVFALYLGIHTRWMYPASAFLQEIFVKAFVQHNLRKTCPQKSCFCALVMTSLFFFLLQFLSHDQ